jgi:hypothetical protein
MLKLIFAFFILFGFIPFKSAMALEYINPYIPDAEKVGEGRLNFMVFSVYDAALYAPRGNFDPQNPYALKLTYLRSINGKDIADTSAEEMRRLGMADEFKLAAWHTQMKAIFPDVKDGTQLTGVYIPGNGTYFYQDGQQIGQINDPEFGDYFFQIWLSENTRLPELRQNLINASND